MVRLHVFRRVKLLSTGEAIAVKLALDVKVILTPPYIFH
jgi:hypothetical protein